jgi:hypothetical protein
MRRDSGVGGLERKPPRRPARARVHCSWPRVVTGCEVLPCRAVAPKLPTIGYVFNGGPGEVGPGQLEGLQDGLRENGFVEGQNLLIEWRWACRNDPCRS